MQKTNPIVIVCICDNHYAVLLATLIKSIELNHHSQEKLDFFLVDDGISSKNKLKISNSINSSITTIHWLKMSACIPKHIKLPIDRGSLPLNIYTRLFIPYFIPENIERVIFLDVDMIILEDISKLWATDFGENIIAAVQDQFIQVVSRWGGVNNYRELGIPPSNKYFNAGLMLIDIKRWQEENITDRVLKCVFENKKNVSFYDQYGLNAILAFKWFSLDPLWNRFAYSEDEQPFLIHFTGRKPIYKTYEYSEKYKDLFYQYLNQTEWKNFKPISETKRYFKKMNNYWGKLKTMIN